MANNLVNCDQAAAHGQQQATDIQSGTKHTQGGQLGGSIWLVRIRTTGLLIQIAVLNGCESPLKYLPVLVILCSCKESQEFSIIISDFC